MSKVTIIFFMLSISFCGLCDHSPYWTLTLNGSTIYDSRKDSLVKERVFQLDFSSLELTDSDTLIIKYRMDTGESGDNHLIFKNSQNHILLDISAMDRANFTLTKKEFDLINCDCRLDVIYTFPWANHINVSGHTTLIEII